MRCGKVLATGRDNSVLARLNSLQFLLSLASDIASLMRRNPTNHAVLVFN